MALRQRSARQFPNQCRRADPAKHIGHDLRQAAEQRRQWLTAPEKINQVLQADFTYYVTEDNEKHRIGCVTEYLSRFNLISAVSDTETALDLIAVVEGALEEIVDLGHRLAGQIILVTDNGPAMKSRRFRNFVKKTELLIHVRSRKYHPQTIGREERYHGSLKLEHLYRVLPNNRTELIEEVKKYRQFYNYERLHMSLGYRTSGCGVLKQAHAIGSHLSQPGFPVPNPWDRTSILLISSISVTIDSASAGFEYFSRLLKRT
jgi:transposase InsO family protein